MLDLLVVTINRNLANCWGRLIHFIWALTTEVQGSGRSARRDLVTPTGLFRNCLKYTLLCTSHLSSEQWIDRRQLRLRLIWYSLNGVSLFLGSLIFVRVFIRPVSLLLNLSYSCLLGLVRIFSWSFSLAVWQFWFLYVYPFLLHVIVDFKNLIFDMVLQLSLPLVLRSSLNVLCRHLLHNVYDLLNVLVASLRLYLLHPLVWLRYRPYIWVWRVVVRIDPDPVVSIVRLVRLPHSTPLHIGHDNLACLVRILNLETVIFVVNISIIWLEDVLHSSGVARVLLRGHFLVIVAKLISRVILLFYLWHL